MIAAQVESVVLCEGYHDRAFWNGWLRKLGFTDPRFPPGTTIPRFAMDPWGKSVTGGHFAFHSPSGHFIRIVPCGGKSKVAFELKRRLDDRATRAVRHVVVNVDMDTNADGMPAMAAELSEQRVEQLVRAADINAGRSPDGDCLLDGGAVTVAVVRWHAADPPALGLPNQHTLERLVCSAITAAYPLRAGSVQAWLDSRPDAPAAGPKEYAWSYMAGWYANLGPEAFYSVIWEDAAIRGELESRLTQGGITRIVAALSA